MTKKIISALLPFLAGVQSQQSGTYTQLGYSMFGTNGLAQPTPPPTLPPAATTTTTETSSTTTNTGTTVGGVVSYPGSGTNTNTNTNTNGNTNTATGETIDPLAAKYAGMPLDLEVCDKSFVYLEGEARNIPAPGVCGRNVLRDARTNMTYGNDVDPLVAIVAYNKLGSFVLDAWNVPQKIGEFQGDLLIQPDGEMDYKADMGNTGLYIVEYTACSTLNNYDCRSANVSITVLEDTNRPSGNPLANADTYSVTEGQSLNVFAPGFLGNDGTQNHQPLFMADYAKSTSSGGMTSKGAKQSSLHANRDGSFEFDAGECWTGTEIYSYQVCYQNYPEMCSSSTINFNVNRDSSRPDPVQPVSDRYTAMEGVQFFQGQPGVLANDRADRGQEMYVESSYKNNGGKGKIKINSDGSVDYTPVSGETGFFLYTYSVCYTYWDCVDCRESTVEIEVRPNPNKPQTGPSPKDDEYDVEQGVETIVDATRGLLANDEYDGMYSIFVSGKGGKELGVQVEKDGSFRYTPTTVGTFNFTYTACYNEWADRCETATVTFNSKAPIPTLSQSRQGRATAYMVQWEGQDEDKEGCRGVTPNVTLTCALGGFVSLLDIGISDKHLCTRPLVPALNGTLVPDDTVIHCSAASAGMLYAECRDMQANNFARRKLSVKMHSDPVKCKGLGSAFHAMSVNTWCNTTTDGRHYYEQWANRGITCSGARIDGSAGSSLCYTHAMGMDTDVQPVDVSINAINYHSCFFNAGFGRRALSASRPQETLREKVKVQEIQTKARASTGPRLRGSK